MKAIIRITRVSSLAFIAMLFLLTPRPTQAQINYQGRLTDANGATIPDGQYSISFSMYDAATSGSLKWGPYVADGGNATGHGPLVDVVGGANPNGGRFNVIIGGTDTNGASLTTALTNNNSLFLEIKVGSNAPISPRQQVLASPRALRADVAILANTLIAPLQQALCPPGSIMAYGGTTAPPGWLMCDGTSYATGTYPALFAVIHNAFGNTAGGANFNVPDLRGKFLRGLDGGANYDPDRSTRTALLAGGNIGDNIGSFQLDQFKLHNHTNGSYQELLQYAQGFNSSGSEDTSPGEPDVLHYAPMLDAGGNETRPVNVNVNYIIKF
jgi:hypothetical protein